MPVFEPSVDTTRNQERIAAVLVPILVMLGGMGLSYGIYTALRWSSFSTRRNFFDTTRSNTEVGVTTITTEMEKPASIAESTGHQDARHLLLESFPKPPSISTCSSQTVRPPQSATVPRLGHDAILARNATKSVNAIRTSKRASLNSGNDVAQLCAVNPEASSHGSAIEKENLNRNLPEQPLPLKSGLESLALGTVPMITPRVPERVVHPIHGYGYL